MTYRGRMTGGRPTPLGGRRPLPATRPAVWLLAATSLLSTSLLSAFLLSASVAAMAGPARAGESTPPALASFYSQTLVWSACGPRDRSLPLTPQAAPAAPAADRRQCTWVTVPLDYAAPGGPTIRLRVVRWPATGSPATGPSAAGRSLLVNPGGPGASGIGFGAYVAASAPDIAAAYDIVGFDPRGVGQSAPITCLTGAQTTALLRTDGTPTTPRQEAAYLAASKTVPDGCLALSPTLARNVGTDSTVRDMDILRGVLGDPVLNWLGASYGTYLGTRYIEQYPDRVGRMVLDGVIDPSLDAMGLSYGQSIGFQRAVTRFAEECARLRTCPYRGDASRIVMSINRLLARLVAHPMATSSGRRLVQAEALNALIYSMYSPLLWPDLRSALAAAVHGDGTDLQRISEAANEQTGPNTYASNSASAFPAIGCWDQPAPPGPDGLRAAARTWAAKATVPEIARALAWGNASCSLWFGHSPVLPAPVTSTTTAPILLIGTTYDPATPLWWAKAVHTQLPTSTLLTFDGDGHTAFGTGSGCVDQNVTAFLVRGILPPSGTVCR